MYGAEQMRQETARLGLACAGGIALIALTACGSSGDDLNFQRGQVLMDVLADANLREASDLSGVLGAGGPAPGGVPATASYTGAAAASFTASENFTATARLDMDVDFNDGSLSGRMSNWNPENANFYTMDGQVLISNGVILPDGSFDAQMAGNVQRQMTAQRRLQLQEDGIEPPEDIQLIFSGVAEGNFHDNWRTGERATHVDGAFSAPGFVEGGFAGRRD